MPSDWTKRSTAILKGPIPYGSTRRFTDDLKRDYPWAIVPEKEFVPLLDRIDATWNPNLEDRHVCLCPLCLGPFSPVAIGYQLASIPPSRIRFVGEQPPRPRGCPYCLGRIARRSMLFCPKCGMTGWEHELSKQADLAGPVALDRTTMPGKPSPNPTRRDRRRGIGAKRKT